MHILLQEPNFLSSIHGRNISGPDGSSTLRAATNFVHAIESEPVVFKYKRSKRLDIHKSLEGCLMAAIGMWWLLYVGGVLEWKEEPWEKANKEASEAGLLGKNAYWSCFNFFDECSLVLGLVSALIRWQFLPFKVERELWEPFDQSVHHFAKVKIVYIRKWCCFSNRKQYFEMNMYFIIVQLEPMTTRSRGLQGWPHTSLY